MQENNELFDLLKINEDSAMSKNVNSIDRALGREFAKMSPSQKTLDNIMAAAARENVPAYKKFFSLFTYRRVLAAAAAVFILALIPGLMLKQKNAGDNDTYAYAVSATVGDIENLDNGLDDIISELDYMEGNI
ncbi:MAG: hypothetical protein LBI01_02320 [Elusimicrobium sp.]|jgi:hypothetical protein|nr:hypothetical protein [Elusimicrobium sp.]